MSRGFAVLLAAMAAGGVLLGARQATFHGGIDIVSVYATVVDSTGRLVPNLTKDDFQIFDNGKRQDLTVFRNEIQPITIVVMLDRSGSMVGHFPIVRDAAEQFVNDLLPSDKAKVGSFSNRVQIDPPEFTSNTSDLIRILRFNLQDAGPTPLWNATFAAMNALEGQIGRRVVLLFTDGYDSPGRPTGNVTLKDVIDRSQAEEMMVYAIGLGDTCGSPANVPRPQSGARYQGRGIPRPPRAPGGPGIGGRFPGPINGPPIGFPGSDMPRGGGDGRGRAPANMGNGTVTCTGSHPDPGLRLLADEGGGGYFELHGTDNLTATFARVADELHHQYLLAFTATALDGKLHALEVRLRDGSMTARARKSYLAPAGK